MTWQEIRAWAIANGWEYGPRSINQNAVRHTSALNPDVWLYVTAQARSVRVTLVPKEGRGEERIMTAFYLGIVMGEGGFPRGMGLWSSPHSPYYHQGKAFG